MELIDSYINKLTAGINRRRNDARIRRMARRVSVLASGTDPEAGNGKAPVVFFNASTRLSGLSLNAGYSLLTAWGLRLAGIPVLHFVCKSGMTRCVLGTNRDDVTQSPPCAQCIRHSRAEYDLAPAVWFEYRPDPMLVKAISDLDIYKLESFEYGDIPLGKLVMPALRWELRRHHLADDESTRRLYREFILSAWSTGMQFTKLLETVTPRAVVVFNGQFFPEATVRYIARQRGIRTVAHEVGLMPFTAFFTDGEATAYPIDIPADYRLTQQQNERLDEYLEKRFKGNFKMAGIQFWQGMQPLDETLTGKMAGFKQTVPVFTNVIFDTSQPHSNVVYPDMFTWLDDVKQIALAHPETLFVIRAHPDELRPGTAKQSRETVRDWVHSSRALELPNIHYIDALEYVSSYELIRRSKFVMVYNSSIGLEAAIMGAPVLSAGRSRYTQYPTVFFPGDIPAYRAKAGEMLAAGHIEVPAEFIENARKFLYFQLFKTGLPFSEFLEESRRPGLVFMKNFPLGQLSAAVSPAIRVVIDGLTRNRPFLLEDE